MIKVTTAHIVKGGLLAGAGAVGYVAANLNPADMSVVGGGLGRFGSFLRTGGIFTLALGALIVLVKFNVIKVLMIQEGETGLLIRRGMVVIDKKTNLPRLVNPKRYQLHIAVVRHIAIVNNRERTIDLGSLPVTIHGDTWVVPLVAKWSINGDPVSMRDALIKVSDGNRFDEKFGALEKMVKEQLTAGLVPAFQKATASLNGNPPTIDYSSVEGDLQARANAYGCHFHELLAAPIYRYGEQHLKDGLNRIGDAIETAGLRSLLPNAV